MLIVTRKLEGDRKAATITLSTVAGILFIIIFSCTLKHILKSQHPWANAIRVYARKIWRALVRAGYWICCLERESPTQNQPQESGVELNVLPSALRRVSSAAVEPTHTAASSALTIVA